jgi:hypothetical protein
VELPRINLPGGLTLAPTGNPSKLQNPCDCLFQLLGMSAPALGALAPLEINIDAALAMNDILGAIPEAVATLNPVPLIQKIVDAAEKIAKLINLAPFLALPRLVLSMLDFMILALDCLILKLQELQSIYEDLGIKADLAIELGNVELGAIIDCAKDDADLQLANLLQAFGALEPIIGMLNMLLGMIPGLNLELSFSTPPPPDTPLDEIIAAIQGFRDQVKDARDLIPL